MSENLVSVIMPAYNHGRYVEEAIRSLINQTYAEIELLVIDDGSSDDCWQKIQALQAECDRRFRRVRFETQANAGTCVTLNRLLAMAEGEFVYIIASDDVAAPQAVQREVEFLSKNPEYVLAVGDNAFIDASSQVVGWDKRAEIVPVEQAAYPTFGAFLQKTHAAVDFASKRFGCYETLVLTNYVPNGYLVRRSALQKMGGCTPEAPLEDWFMILQLAKIGKMKYFDEVLFFYRQHGCNTAKRREHMREMARKNRAYEQALVNQPGNEQWKAIFDTQMYAPKMRFALGSWLRYYKVFELCSKKKILEICGHKFVIKTKPW